MALPERFEVARKQARGDGLTRGDVERVHDVSKLLFERVVKPVDAFHERQRASVEASPLRAQLDVRALAHEEIHAEFRFQTAYLERQRGLAQVQVLCRPGEVAAACRVAERA